MSASDSKLLFGRGGFDINVDMCTGLELRVNGGVLLTGVSPSYHFVSGNHLTLTASATNYVEASDAGAITSNTTGFTDGATALYVVTTNATMVTGLYDCRGGFAGAAKYPIDPTGIRAVTGVVISATELSGGFNLNYASHVLLLQGEVTNNETETSVGLFRFTLPQNYVPGGAVSLRIKCANIGAGTQTSCTITVEAYKANGNGAVGSNLGPAAQTHAAKTTWYTKDFAITTTGLVAGDTLNVELTVADIESASSNLVWTADELAMLVTVQG